MSSLDSHDNVELEAAIHAASFFAAKSKYAPRIYSYSFFYCLMRITGSTVAQHCCKGDQPFQWENPKFDPPRISLNPFAQMITSGISPDVQNLVKIRSRGASPRIGEI